jgi:3-phenylpropionate/trans-cinnamate dioxygenase ferredoxin reductase subunit
VSERVLVVGASHAGIQLAAALRDLGHAGALTVVGEEPHRPYHRPPLSKAYLAGAASAASLALRSDSFFAANDIGLVLGQRVAHVDLDRGEAHSTSGTRLDFDRLALATGARVRRLAVPGRELDGIVYLRDLDDADRMARLMGAARRAVVVGGGFIGLEAAAVLRERGVEVTVVEASTRLMARSVSREMSEFYVRLHRSKGTNVRLGVGVVGFDGEDGRVNRVLLEGGAVLPTDLVVVGIGVEPRTELAEQLGLAVDGGIVVDQSARTSDPRVVAVGDAAVLPHPLEPGRSVRLESVQNATDQAAVAASTLLGEPRRYDAVPWFWSDQFDLKLQMAGAAADYDEVAMRGSMERGRFTILCYREGTLVAGECVNSGADFIAVRRALAAGTTFPPNLVTDESVKLKTLL